MRLTQIVQKIARCKKCPLWKSRRNSVPGEGNLKARIMFIGEAPGMQEDKQGRPFVGQAGKFLEKMLCSIDLKREDIFITNLVKCRPPANRDPKREEIETCWPYLQEQIKFIQPKLIITLGRHALQKFIPHLSISKIHGQPKRKNIPTIGRLIFYPLFHPSAALYQGNLRQTLIRDFKKIPKVLKKSINHQMAG